METQERQKELVGGVETVSIDVDDLMKCQDLTFNKLTLLCGMNGTGKSVILVINWALNMISNMYLMVKKIPNVNQKELMEHIVQWIFNTSFYDQNFNGTIVGKWKRLEIKIELDKGKLVNLEFIQDESVNLEIIGIPLYLSTNTRLFTAIISYIQIKKGLGLPMEITLFDETSIAKLTDMYKLYDIIFMEKVLLKFKDPFFKFRQDTSDMLFELTKKRFLGVFYNEKNSQIFCRIEKEDKTIEDKNVLTLSNGEQSLIMMYAMTT